ncbi:probable LRR receptor-like serine/threonine-protein kinase At1g06840 [Arachis stenosperma]|uniref:probable LRR receptor-like serine/threonine-protein kinase At1g06840 n=1 Tax=Arachis stenosperma TaxID=217475 RepID=UPI0025ACB58E|nr:probable LRR receptor-like serine/threonine-protein kinase At1g06840 [Arachis stenosperma]
MSTTSMGTMISNRRRIHGYVLAVSFCYLISTTVAQSTHPSEVDALLQIKKSLIDPLNHLWNWNKGDPCTSNWNGVLCPLNVGADGHFHVKELYLMTMNLSGNLVPQLGQLSQLEIMNFMWNNITGSIPREIGNITSLRFLLLNGNALSGNLPYELGNLQNLNRFQVDQNQLSGPIPPSFANLSSVKHIHMNNNSFSGQIPPNLSNLSNLLHLLLDTNNLSGYLPPEFSILPQLRILQLDNNHFTGSRVPSSYANLSRLAKLSLRNCSLIGEVPDLSSIPQLYYLDLSWNNLIGPIPSKKLAENMTTIDLSNNNLNGSIPGYFSELPSLQRLSLENNNFSGSISAKIWQKMTLTTNAKLTIDLRNNSLSRILGDPSPPPNVTLRLGGNPICKSSQTSGILAKQCGFEGEEEDNYLTNSTTTCPPQACSVNDFFEYVPDSPIPCFCASPLRIGYRLKSPSFSFFPPYKASFRSYVTHALNLDFYQLSVDSYSWEEEDTRLRMYLKLFPEASYSRNQFNSSEVYRMRSIFSSWNFGGSDFYGPYELLNFTLEGPYEYLITKSEKSKSRRLEIIFAVVAAVAVVIAISAIVTLIIVRRDIKKQDTFSRRRRSSSIPIKIDGVKEFTFKEMVLATDSFSSSNQVGRGGYGTVYKGTLPDETIVAIKRAQEDSLQGTREFLNEIELLSRLHHRNLVSLIGYCDQEGEQMLVYEFMPNGNLRDWLSGTKGNLTFGMRLRIAIGSAKGILYLHTEANPPIFHRDIKASNILLDSKMIAKVADFGLSRLAPHLDEGNEPKYVSTVVKGTPGYLDPEYLLTHKLTDKSDVYSLGVVFMELLTGMQPISHGKNIVREVNMAYNSGMIFSIIDSKMGSYPSDCIERFSTLAINCCHDVTQKRPSMLDVVRELENIAAMLPGTETSFSDIICHNDSSLQSSSSSSFMPSKDHHGSSSASEICLVSGAISTILPR